jgi:hypothetical protein
MVKKISWGETSDTHSWGEDYGNGRADGNVGMGWQGKRGGGKVVLSFQGDRRP